MVHCAARGVNIVANNGILQEVRQWPLFDCLPRSALGTQSVAFATCLQGTVFHIFTHQLALFLIRILRPDDITVPSN